MIQPQEPPLILKPSENQSEQEALKISITKLLLKSYYDIVRKQIEDIVPKTIMHFMVNHTKRELYNVFIRKFNSENLFDSLFREPDDIAVKRKMSSERLGLLQQAYKDINLNRSIKEALANEEAFFRRQPVYHGLSHCCGVPKLAKKLNQVLVEYIWSVLPGLKARINSQLVVVAKEHVAYGDVVEPNAGQGVKLLNILTKYCEAFTSMIGEKNEELLIGELSGGARIHYIFQSIFLKSLEKVDPFEDVSDEDIRMAIQNAADPEGALLVPEVLFEVLVRRQIGRLLFPSLQCAKFIYYELIKMSHRSLANELHQYPFLRKCMDDVIRDFLREGLQRAEIMITHLIETEIDYINFSHPNFIGKNKAVEIAQQQVKASRLAASVSRPKLIQKLSRIKTISNKDVEISQQVKASKLAASVSRPKGVQPPSDSDRLGSAGSSRGSGPILGISSIFGVSENRALAKEISSNKPATAPSHNVEHSLSMIQPQEPPVILKPSENQSEQEALEISITKLLLKSYYDIVRKQIEDIVPKTIMHFMVNHTKRELHDVFIRKLYRENLFDDLLRESDDIAANRKMTWERLSVLLQAYKMLEELPLEADIVEKGYSLVFDSTWLA